MTKVSNAYNKLKSGAKSALGYMGKSIKNFFVPESAYASSSSSSSTKKSAPKQTDLYQQMLLTSQYYQYVQSGGTKSFYEFKNSSSVNNAVHGMLDLAGLLFDAADAINAAWYAAEGDYENAGISGMGIIPVIGIGKTGSRVAKTTKNMFKAGDAGKTATKEATAAKTMLGANGTVTRGSLTLGKNGKTERVDVENMAPGKRPGNLHYHDSNNVKWQYDIKSGKFVDPKTRQPAPEKVQKVLNEKWVQNAIKQGKNVLGE